MEKKGRERKILISCKLVGESDISLQCHIHFTLKDLMAKILNENTFLCHFSVMYRKL